jgi:hypothetical protein
LVLGCLSVGLTVYAAALLSMRVVPAIDASGNIVGIK